MKLLLLNESPPSAGDAMVPNTAEMLVSCVRNARDTATQHYAAKEIIEAIREGKRFRLREPVENIRNTFANAIASTEGDRKAAKQAVAEDKKQLPAVKCPCS
jgi:hypothetical protein